MSGWNGWSYGAAQQKSPTSTGNADSSGGPSVNYVQLNWGDLLGGQGTQQTVSSTGTSAFQIPNQQQSSYQGVGYHQNGQPQNAATFRVSVGNQGDQNMYQLINPDPSQVNSMGQAQFPGSGGDYQNAGQQLSKARSKPSASSAPQPRKVVPCCGTCTACKYQKSRASTKPFLVRNDGHLPK